MSIPLLSPNGPDRARPLRSVADDAPVHLLGPDGSVNRDFPWPVDLSATLCRQLYRDMVLARRLDQEAHHLQRQGELGLWLSCEGQEAAQVGSARAVRSSDYIFPSYREHAVAVVRGVTPGELLAQWRGCVHGGWDPARYRMHITSLVLGTQTLHATGYAMGVRAEQSDEVVLVYLGDGATSQGDVSEALNWAAVTGAPIVFFCQNNQWAISTPTAQQTGTELHRRAAGFGLDSLVVDGNDVLGVLGATRAAAERVRAGGRPVFIEAMTYRMAGHSTADDPGRYRPAADTEMWRERDPIARLRTLLTAQGWTDPEHAAALQKEADRLAADTRAACLALEPGPLTDTFRHTLVAETAALRAERLEFTAYQNGFA